MARTVRLTTDERREVIVGAILKVAEDIGKYNLTHDNVAFACTVTTSRHTVKHYFPAKQDLYDIVDLSK